MRRDQSLEFQARLGKILLEEENARGSASALEKAIRAANAGRGKLGLDRRRLGSILSGNPVRFSYQELAALDAYLLWSRGTGLSAVFERQSLIKAVASEGRIVFLLGAKPGIQGTTGV